MDLGCAIRARRKELDMSQPDLARAVGVTRSAVSQWERGETSPTYKTLLKVAKVLGMSARDLFYPPEEPEEKEDSKNVP